MKKIIFATVFALASLCGAAIRSQTVDFDPMSNLSDLHRASCRIRATDGTGLGSVGTGTVNALIDGYYLVSTNWHVVDGARKYELEFFGDGKPFVVEAKLEQTWNNDAPTDVAILSVPESALRDYAPPILPLAPRGTKTSVDAVIMSCGCSEGRPPFAWVGRVKPFFGKMGQFYPAPKGGQSGSAIAEWRGDHWEQTGWLAYRVGDERTTSEENMLGGFIPIENWYATVDGRVSTTGSTDGKTGLPPFTRPCVLRIDADDATAKDAQTNDAPEIPTVDAAQNAVLRIGETPKVERAVETVESIGKPTQKGVIIRTYVFTMLRCAACENAKPTVEKLKTEGFEFYYAPIENAEYRRKAAELNVSKYPTFLTFLSKDGGKTWTVGSRIVGCDASLEWRLRRALSVGAGSGSNGQNIDDDAEESAASPQRTSPKVDAILNLYGNGFRFRPKLRDDESPPIPDASPGKPDSGGSSWWNPFDGQSFLDEIKTAALDEISKYAARLFWFAVATIFFAGLISQTVLGVIVNLLKYAFGGGK